MDIPLGENKEEILPKKEEIVSDIIKVNIIKEEKSKKKFENINSPQLIQQILKLSTNSIQNDYHHQNNIIKSLYSFNDSILPIIEDDYTDNNNIINFNPQIQFLLKKNKLSSMNFAQVNKKNDYLLDKIEQYNDLKEKVSNYKLNLNKEKESNDDIDNIQNQKKELSLKLFLINHPLINLFKEEIDIKEIKKEIENEYLKKMKDNSDYKPGPLNPHLINIQEQENSHSEESIEESEQLNESDNSGHSGPIFGMDEIELIENNSADQDENNNENIDNQNNIELQNIHEEQNNNDNNENNENDQNNNINEAHAEQNNQIEINPPLNIDPPSPPSPPSPPLNANHPLHINPPLNIDPLLFIPPPIIQIINSENPLPNPQFSPPVPIIAPVPDVNNLLNLNNDEINHVNEPMEIEELPIENNNNEENKEKEENLNNENNNENEEDKKENEE